MALKTECVRLEGVDAVVHVRLPVASGVCESRRREEAHPANVWGTGEMRACSPVVPQLLPGRARFAGVPRLGGPIASIVKRTKRSLLQALHSVRRHFVTADFVPHRVEKAAQSNESFSEKLTHDDLEHKPLRLGALLEDRGLLQDMFSFEYRPFTKLSPDQRRDQDVEAIYPSNFMTYARNHAIIALASSNMGTEDASDTLVSRNMYRILVDTYECMPHKANVDGVPVIMGFRPRAVSDVVNDRRVVELFAGTVRCMNFKFENLSTSKKSFPLYRMSYFNDAAILFTRLLRQAQRKTLHDDNFNKAQQHRPPGYTKEKYNEELIEIMSRQIEFLNTIGIELALKNGATLDGLDLSLLEPREVVVPMKIQDQDVVGQDYMTPATIEATKTVGFDGQLDDHQMAMLSILPPNERMIGLLSYKSDSGVVDMEATKKKQEQILKENKRKANDYIKDVLPLRWHSKFFR